MTRVIGGMLMLAMLDGYKVQEDKVLHQDLRDHFYELAKSNGGKETSRKSERKEWFAQTSYINASSDEYSFPQGEMHVGMISVENPFMIAKKMQTPVQYHVEFQGEDAYWNDSGLVSQVQAFFSRRNDSLQYDVQE